MSSSLLPPNTTLQERALEGAVERLSAVPVTVGDLWNPRTCPASALPWLAWALSVDEWNAQWPEEARREVLAASLTVHGSKGTVWALLRALAAAGYADSQVIEWFERGGEPYTGLVLVNLYTEGLDEAAWARIGRLIEETKNVRSHLDLRVYLTVKSEVPRYALAGQAAELVTIYPWNTLDVSGSAPLRWALGSQAVETLTVYPSGTPLVPTAPPVNLPANGATLAGPSQTFTWTDVGADLYDLWVGSSAGTYNLFEQPSTGTSVTATGLPTDGSTVYVRMWAKFGEQWFFNDYTYRASGP